MKIDPKLIERPEQPYAGIRRRVAREHLADVVPQTLAEVRELLAAANIQPSGPPLIRYLVVDYNMDSVEVDIGLPVATADLPDHLNVRPGMLPAGTYASVLHSGDYSSLVETTAALLDWPSATRSLGTSATITRSLTGPAASSITSWGHRSKTTRASGRPKSQSSQARGRGPRVDSKP